MRKLFILLFAAVMAVGVMAQDVIYRITMTPSMPR